MEEPKVLPQSRKRPFEQNTPNIQDSPCYKARAVLKDLRPHFIEKENNVVKPDGLPNAHRKGSGCGFLAIKENNMAPMVLKTADFQNCKAAGDIREGMKLLINLYKDMITESMKQETCNNNPPAYSSPNIPNGQKPVEHRQDVKPAENSHQNAASIEISGHGVKGTYIVGGSAFGWNFITFNGDKAVYYGRTKEDFRAANPKSAE
ncbi:hypothetical protein DH2020_023166 [Rehmannia glutinosa]|uniref:Uncharacterized protein n=1 Tax=Rehmannia glutinosa TaxID=99300 RepID=A0ABR0W7L6_REHGL